MKRLALFSLTVLMVVSLMVASEGRAYGYVDPGTGLMALQGFASAVAAASFFFRSKLKALFARKKPETAIVMPMQGARKTDNRNAA